MAHSEFYKYINEQIRQKGCLSTDVLKIIERYKKNNRQEIARFFNNTENFLEIKESIEILSKDIDKQENPLNIQRKLNEITNNLNKGISSYNIQDENVTENIYQILIFTLIRMIDKLVKSPNKKKLTKKELIELEKSKNLSFFRGQSDYSWSICPSFVRGLGESAIVNKTYIKNKYSESGLIEKFCKTINRDVDTNVYFLYSFIQHSISYSVLNDITKNPTIATSFALSNVTSINNYYGIDSSLFEFKVSEEKIISNVEEINEKLNKNSFIVLNDGKFSFGSEILIKNKKISFNSFEEILKHMKPEFYIFDAKTSDRMKYQQGAFIYFFGDEFIIFNNRIFYELCDELEINEYLITKKEKETLLKFIKNKKRYYDQEHLMNPYKFFEE